MALESLELGAVEADWRKAAKVGEVFRRFSVCFFLFFLESFWCFLVFFCFS